MRGQLYAPPKFFKEHKNGRVASPERISIHFKFTWDVTKNKRAKVYGNNFLLFFSHFNLCKVK